MNFNHIKLKELDFDLQATTTERGREYLTPRGHSYPSVTTVLSEYNKKALFEWRERVGAEEDGGGERGVVASGEWQVTF